MKERFWHTPTSSQPVGPVQLVSWLLPGTGMHGHQRWEAGNGSGGFGCETAWPPLNPR